MAYNMSKEYKELTTIQYMGSKSRILSEVCKTIEDELNSSTLVDLFAGSGTIGYALSDKYKIISNDLEYYSYIINKAILNGCCVEKDKIKSFFNEVKVNYEYRKEYFKASFQQENDFFKSESNDITKYKEFVEKTPSIFNRSDTLVEIQSLVDKILVGKKQNSIPFDCLFVTYYANAYFGIQQCCQIDSIRDAINNVHNESLKNVLLTALMSTMSITATTTTHFAQFLKVKSKSTAKNIIDKRKSNIIEKMEEIVDLYFENGLFSKTGNNICTNLDYEEFLDNTELEKNSIIYADPPYFKEHYSRYYHLLNTVCLYDYPEPSINKQTHKLSIGRYRKNRTVSDFGKKAKALYAFEKMIKKCRQKDCFLVISYSNNSIVKIDNLIEIAKKYYNVKYKKIPLSHSKQGRGSVVNVDEFIIICK